MKSGPTLGVGATACVMALVALLASSARWPRGPQGALLPEAQALGDAGSDRVREAAADRAYGAVEVALQAVARADPAARPAALERVRAACADFVREHGPAARAEDLATAGRTWLQLAEEHGPAAQARAVKTLEALRDLPPALASALAASRARLETGPGRPEPAWQVALADGELRAGDLAGLRLLSFWNAWNPHCRDLLRNRLVPLGRRHPALTLVHVGLPRQEDFSRQRAFLSAAQAPGWAAFDADGSCAAAFGVEGTPTLCLVDAAGQVRVHGPGLQVIDEVERFVRAATQH